jgi:hypothetical protein
MPSGRPIFEEMLTGASRANTEGGFIVSESFAFHVSEKQGCVRLEVARHTSTDPDGTPVVQSLMRPEEARKLARFLNAYAYDVDHAMPALDASAMMRFDRDS